MQIRFSPDGSSVLANWQGELFQVQLDTGARHQIVPVHTASAEEADWARDGSRVVYRQYIQPFGIWITDTKNDTDTLLQVAGTPVDGGFPHWSPQKDVIVFSRGSIDEVMADGSSQMTLLLPPKGHTFDHPRWFPDGQSIAFTDHGTTDRTLVMSASGTNLRTVPMSIGESEAFSPDGKDVIVADRAKDDSTHQAIVLYRRALWDSDGSTMIQLTTAKDTLAPAPQRRFERP